MIDQDKPLSEWTLKEVQEHCEKLDGRCSECKQCQVYQICNETPDNWELIPRFTDEEVAVLRHLYAAGARYLARGKHLRWYHNKPYQQAEDDKWDMRGDWGTMSGKLPAKLFPYLLPGQSVSLKDIIGGK